MIGTSTAIRGFVITLASGILAATFIPLGIVFTILAGDEFPIALGLALLGVGLLSAVEALVFHRWGRRRTAAEAAARVSSARAQVITADHNWNSRVGARHPVKLTIDFGGRQHTRTLYVPSHLDWAPGEWIEVDYAHEDPANFIPVIPRGTVDRQGV